MYILVCTQPWPHSSSPSDFPVSGTLLFNAFFDSVSNSLSSSEFFCLPQRQILFQVETNVFPVHLTQQMIFHTVIFLCRTEYSKKNLNVYIDKVMYVHIYVHQFIVIMGQVIVFIQPNYFFLLT